MSAPAGSPHPAAGARMPPKLGGAASGLAPPQQNGPAPSQMQVPSGYGLPHQNYMAPSGHYSQGPGKMTSLPLDNQCDSYYSRPYTVPTQNVGTPSSANQPGAQQMYGRGPPASHLAGSTPGSFQGAPASASHPYPSASQPYSSFGNRYSSPAPYSASSSAASQGYPSTSSQYPISTVSNVVYPNVSYPSLPASEPYGQMFTSQSAPSARPVKDSYSGPNTAITYPPLKDSYSGPNTAITYPPRPPPPPSQQHHQPQSHSGYSSGPWSAPGLPPTQDNLIRNQMGPVAPANNHPTNNENVQPPKSSSIVSTVLPGPSSARMPPAPSHPVGPMPSAPPPPEPIQTKVRFPVPSPVGCGKWRLSRDPGLWGTCIARMRERPPEKFANKGVKRLRPEPTEKPKVWPLKPIERSPRRRPPAQTSRRATPPTWGQIKRLMQMSEEGARGLGLGNNPAATFLMCLVIISIQSGVEHYSEPPLD